MNRRPEDMWNINPLEEHEILMIGRGRGFVRMGTVDINLESWTDTRKMVKIAVLPPPETWPKKDPKLKLKMPKVGKALKKVIKSIIPGGAFKGGLDEEVTTEEERRQGFTRFKMVLRGRPEDDFFDVRESIFQKKWGVIRHIMAPGGSPVEYTLHGIVDEEAILKVVGDHADITEYEFVRGVVDEDDEDEDGLNSPTYAAGYEENPKNRYNPNPVPVFQRSTSLRF